MARANLQPAVARYLRAPGEAGYRPLALEVLHVFPRAAPSNKDKLNAMEVR